MAEVQKSAGERMADAAEAQAKATARMADAVEALVVTVGAAVKAMEARPAAAFRPVPAGGNGGTGATFPNYGRSKNAPVAGATVEDLEYYASGCRRTLDDDSKAKWHDKEHVLLAAIGAELAKHGRDPHDGRGPPPPGFDDPPQRGGAPVDEDIPF